MGSQGLETSDLEGSEFRGIVTSENQGMPSVKTLPLRVYQRTAKGASGKGPRQKSSKSVKNIFDDFRHFSRRAKKVKNHQKVLKIFSTLFDSFPAAPLFRPLLGGSECKNRMLIMEYTVCVQSA